MIVLALKCRCLRIETGAGIANKVCMKSTAFLFLLIQFIVVPAFAINCSFAVKKFLMPDWNFRIETLERLLPGMSYHVIPKGSKAEQFQALRSLIHGTVHSQGTQVKAQSYQAVDPLTVLPLGQNFGFLVFKNSAGTKLIIEFRPHAESFEFDQIIIDIQGKYWRWADVLDPENSITRSLRFDYRLADGKRSRAGLLAERFENAFWKAKYPDYNDSILEEIGSVIRNYTHMLEDQIYPHEKEKIREWQKEEKKKYEARLREINKIDEFKGTEREREKLWIYLRDLQRPLEDEYQRQTHFRIP